MHERALWLSPDGLNLRGEDNFVPVADTSRRTANHQSYAIRFHLHPSVKATLSQDQNSAMLLLPDRSGWRFSAKGARLSLEDSVYLVDRPNPSANAADCALRLCGRGPQGDLGVQEA